MPSARSFSTHGPERRHVGESHSVGELQQPAGEPPRHDLLPRQAARLAVAAHAGADHEIDAIGGEWAHQIGHERRNVAAVAIEKTDDLSAHSSEASGAGTAITPARFGYDTRARRGRFLRGAIG
jgi:hypothetical protein